MASKVKWYVAFRFTDSGSPQMYRILDDAYNTKDEAINSAKVMICSRKFETIIVSREVEDGE